METNTNTREVVHIGIEMLVGRNEPKIISDNYQNTSTRKSEKSKETRLIYYFVTAYKGFFFINMLLCQYCFVVVQIGWKWLKSFYCGHHPERSGQVTPTLIK